ncbi:MAG TPA: hypothetical protein VIM61_12735 [Chthoniobacterales bacterium]|jgi:hypothetical protein
MKILAFLLAAVALTVGSIGCATNAAVDTPIVDVGAGGSVGR